MKTLLDTHVLPSSQRRAEEECVHGLFEARVERHPQAIAIGDGQDFLHYAELNRAANRVAHRLIACGVQREDLIGICIERSCELLVAVLGCLKAGAAYVPLDPAYPRERLAYMVRDAQLKRVITTSRAAASVAEMGSELVPMHLVSADGVDDSNPTVPGLNADSLAYAVYTSGSTGAPKASLIEHRGLCNLAAAQLDMFGAQPGSKVLQFASFSFDAATFEWVMALAAGAQLCMLPEARVRDPDALTRYVQEQGITHATLPPILLPRLDAQRWQGMRTLIVAGEACSRDLAEAWSRGRSFYNAYGPSEMTIWATTGRFVPGQQVVHIGQPIANTRCYVLADDGSPSAVGEPGELYLAGAGISRGYLNRPELTAEKFLPDPFCVKGMGELMYRTGDRVRVLPSGDLEFLGRVDRQVKVRGFRIELEEIEHVLEQHPAVTNAVVEACDHLGTRRLIAYAVVDSSAVDLRNSATQQALEGWQEVFDDAYRSADVTRSRDDDPLKAFSDFTGWNSSFTRAPIEEASMQDWRRATVDRIRTLRPQRILEVGCGAGLLMSELVASCDHYVGIDVAAAVIGRLRRSLYHLGEHASKVELYVSSAHELHLGHRKFDLILVNSVVQCFPDERYLFDTLSTLNGLLEEGGSLFIGDVRNLYWNESFHSQIERLHATETADPARFVQRVMTRVQHDKELVLAPEFFLDRIGALPQVSRVEVLPKLGRYDNEMNVYRYDVQVRKGSRSEPLEAFSVAERTWVAGDSMTTLETELAGLGSPESWRPLIVRDVPNARLAEPLAFWHEQRALVAGTRVGTQARIAAVDPLEWIDLGSRLGCTAHFALGVGLRHDRFDVLLLRGEPIEAFLPALYSRYEPEHREYSNSPLLRELKQAAEPLLREYLQYKLPSYMQPSAIVILDGLPMNRNGKVDRAALPVPSTLADVSEAGELHTDTQQTVSRIWCRTLGIPHAGRSSNFYHVGGDSLSAVRVAAALREELGVEMEMAEFQRIPTLGSLAERLDLMLARQKLTLSGRDGDSANTAQREVLRL